MSVEYGRAAKVDAVSGPVGPLYFTNVEIAGVPVQAMVDPGSSATILSFELFKLIGKQAKIPSEALRPPTIALKDYSQRAMPIGACVELPITWNGQTATIPVYLRSELGVDGEPCLLGTNIVVPMGMMVPGPGVQPRTAGVDLLRSSELKAAVQLVQAQCLPSHCAKFVEASTEAQIRGDGDLIFTPPDCGAKTGSATGGVGSKERREWTHVAIGEECVIRDRATRAKCGFGAG